jgi:hypothetical protein
MMSHLFEVDGDGSSGPRRVNRHRRYGDAADKLSASMSRELGQPDCAAPC